MTSRGIFATLGVLLLVLALLGLAIPLAGEPGRNSATASYVLDVDKSTDRFADVQYGLARIISPAVNFTVVNRSVLTEERVPMDYSFADDLESFARFENNSEEGNVSIDAGSASNGTFYILPNNVRISQGLNRMYLTPLSGNGGISELEINVTFAAGNADRAQWESLQTSPVGSPDALPVRVRVTDTSYALYEDFAETLNRSMQSRINITLSGNLVGYVQFSPPGSVEIYSAPGADLKALARFSNPVRVEADGTISVQSLANKTGRIRVA